MLRLEANTEAETDTDADADADAQRYALFLGLAFGGSGDASDTLFQGGSKHQETPSHLQLFITGGGGEAQQRA